MLTAYGVYYVTRKGPDGRSILDDILENPETYLKKAKDGLLEDTARAVKRMIN